MRTPATSSLKRSSIGWVNSSEVPGTTASALVDLLLQVVLGLCGSGHWLRGLRMTNVSASCMGNRVGGRVAGAFLRADEIHLGHHRLAIGAIADDGQLHRLAELDRFIDSDVLGTCLVAMKKVPFVERRDERWPIGGGFPTPVYSSSDADERRAHATGTTIQPQLDGASRSSGS